MVKTIIINGSPRTPKSNSKLYAEIFQKYYSGETISFMINKKITVKFVTISKVAQTSCSYFLCMRMEYLPLC